ncbi:MAG: response regulator [Candidatus Cloacimonetes bacterium]|nr:response regulator [Candidatus Cloacimonadota bacterium]
MRLINVLYIEKDPDDSKIIHDLLGMNHELKYKITQKQTLSNAIEEIEKNKNYQIILLDLAMPESSGMKTFYKFKDHASNIPLIVLTGSDCKENIHESLQNGAQDLLIKGQFDHKLLHRTINYSIDRKKSEIAIQKRDRILESISRISKLFLKSKNLDNDIKNCLQILGNMIDVGRVYIFQNSISDSGKLVMNQKYYWIKQDQEILKNKKMKREYKQKDSDLYAYLSENKAFYGNVRELKENDKHFFEKFNIQSFVIVPIHVNFDWWGFIGFDDCIKERVWSYPEIDALKTVSDVISSVIQRNLFEQALHDYREQLKLINKILRHDLTNNLSSIKSGIRMYKRTKDPQYLEALNESLVSGIELINKMRNHEQFVASHQTLVTFSTDSIIRNIIRQYPDIEFIITGSGLIKADETIITVFDNIIKNAVIHGKTKKIEIKTTSNQEFCEIEIADFGIGIPDRIKDYIFDEGFKFGLTGHTGQGLNIVLKEMEKFGGSVYVEDNQPTGTRFILTFIRERRTKERRKTQRRNDQKQQFIEDRRNSRRRKEVRRIDDPAKDKFRVLKSFSK